MAGKRRNPVEVGCQNSVLVGRRSPAHQFEGTQVRGEKAQTRDPCRHIAAGHEEIFAAATRELLQIEPDPQHRDKVDRDDQNIGCRQRDDPVRVDEAQRSGSQGNIHARLSFSTKVYNESPFKCCAASNLEYLLHHHPLLPRFGSRDGLLILPHQLLPCTHLQI